MSEWPAGDDVPEHLAKRLRVNGRPYTFPRTAPSESTGGGLRECRALARHHPEQTPRGLRETSFARMQPAVANRIERRDDGGSVGRDLHARVSREALGTADRTIRPHVDDRLLVRVDPEPHEEERLVRRGAAPSSDGYAWSMDNVGHTLGPFSSREDVTRDVATYR